MNGVAALSLRLGLKLNPQPTKCRTLHVSGQQPVGTRPTTFHIGESAIPNMKDLESHNFLGRPVGYRLLSDTACVYVAITLGKRLLRCMVAVWEGLDAIKTSSTRLLTSP